MQRQTDKLIKRKSRFQTSCDLNMTANFRYWVFIKYSKISKYILASLGFPSAAGQSPALQQNLQSSEKSQHFKEKTQYLRNTLYINLFCEFLFQTLYGLYPENLELMASSLRCNHLLIKVNYDTYGAYTYWMQSVKNSNTSFIIYFV